MIYACNPYLKQLKKGPEIKMSISLAVSRFYSAFARSDTLFLHCLRNIHSRHSEYKFWQFPPTLSFKKMPRLTSASLKSTHSSKFLGTIDAIICWFMLANVYRLRRWISLAHNQRAPVQLIKLDALTHKMWCKKQNSVLTQINFFFHNNSSILEIKFRKKCLLC